MKTFKIFLASSGTLAEERKEIGLFIGSENNHLVKKGIFIELVVWEDLLKSFSMEDVCNFNEKYKGTTEVGRFKKGKSPYDCYDMAGNVWEWCADVYSDDNRKDPDNPLKVQKHGDRRVLRGGSWDDYRDFLRCADRNWDVPNGRYDDAGFRCVR